MLRARAPFGVRCPAQLARAPAKRPRALKLCVVRAKEDGNDSEKAADDRSVKEAVEELKAANIDKETAQQILSMWKSSGIGEEPEELRQLYRSRSLAIVARFAIQLLFDAGACYGAYSVSQSLGDAEFFGRGFVQLVFNAIAFNYAIGFFSDAFAMYVSLSTMNRFGTNASSYLQAFKTIAGSEALDSLAKAKAAVDGFKVAQALERMDAFLKEKAASASEGSRASTLDSLAVYLTLQKARDLYGFKQEDFDLSDDEAIDIARVFSAYDTNDDYRLDLSEFERLCQDAGRPLSRAEAQAALSAIDADGNGTIDFTEFVKFWKTPRSQAAVPVQP